jgi:hypothetical protein
MQPKYAKNSQNRKQSFTRLGAHPVTHESVLNYDFRVSGSESKFGRIDPDSDPEHVLFEAAAT